nr:hypothetical protein Iba_chr12dCG2330 [Ipomoea batatas]
MRRKTSGQRVKVGKWYGSVFYSSCGMIVNMINKTGFWNGEAGAARQVIYGMSIAPRMNRKRGSGWNLRHLAHLTFSEGEAQVLAMIYAMPA